jgi:AmmeMemoRadiSam system protein B/AmmeMemoRadiSam system protein A
MQVDALLAESKPVAEHASPVALIVPHAGYVYSGHVAAQAFKQIEGLDFGAMVVVGVNHRDPTFRQVSVWAEGAFETPLGLALVDEDLAADLVAADERIVFDRGVHEHEHSVEVQLPFLQRIYRDDLRFVPVVIGDPSTENIHALAGALARVLEGKRALIIASADLSHYPAYDDALRSDAAILQAILSLDSDRFFAARDAMMAGGIPNLSTCSCGEGPVLTAMIAAKELGADHATLLRYANSGDTPFGERDQVVGYGAVAFWRGEQGGSEAGLVDIQRDLLPIAPLSAKDKASLLELARASLERFLVVGDVPIVRPAEPGLWQERGAFVTLEQDGELRGCIGELVGRRPLYLSVQWAALSAALADRRFPPLRQEELGDIEIEVSALTELQELRDPNDVEVGVHGLLIARGEQRGVLLPQVAVDEGWSREEFLQAVCRKAGLPEDAWGEAGTKLYWFQAEVFQE